MQKVFLYQTNFSYLIEVLGDATFIVNIWKMLTLNLKAPAKSASENVVCLSRLLQIFDNTIGYLSIELNSVDPDQTDLVLDCLSKEASKHFSRRQKQTTFVVIDTLWIDLVSRARFIKIKIIDIAKRKYLRNSSHFYCGKH